MEEGCSGLVRGPSRLVRDLLACGAKLLLTGPHVCFHDYSRLHSEDANPQLSSEGFSLKSDFASLNITKTIILGSDFNKTHVYSNNCAKSRFTVFICTILENVNSTRNQLIVLAPVYSSKKKVLLGSSA